MDSGFPVLPAATASTAERLAWLDGVRQRGPAALAANIFAVEEVFSQLPDTEVSSVTGCAIRQHVKQILDANAHISTVCQICQIRHGLPRDEFAKSAVQQFAQSLRPPPPAGAEPAVKLQILRLDPPPPAPDNRETKAKASALAKFAEELNNKGTMLGALVCLDETQNPPRIVTLFGSTGSVPRISEGCVLATMDNKWLVPAINREGEYNVATGRRIPVSAIQKPPGGIIAGACAAQRLLQFALGHGLKPVALAELWFGNEKADGTPRRPNHLYTSCNTCRAVMGIVLCPRGAERPAPAPLPPSAAAIPKESPASSMPSLPPEVVEKKGDE